jgi:hypothetical protein
MVQDASDDGGVDNEGEELHFSPASRPLRSIMLTSLRDVVEERGLIVANPLE